MKSSFATTTLRSIAAGLGSDLENNLSWTSSLKSPTRGSKVKFHCAEQDREVAIKKKGAQELAPMRKTMATKDEQSAGREANDALPAGERPGLISSKGVDRTGRREQQTAGPDGPDAGEIGKTFKHPPGEAHKSASKS